MTNPTNTKKDMNQMRESGISPQHPALLSM